MSWNKPSSAPQQPPKKSAPPSLKRGLLAGLVVVALGALGLYLFSSGEATSSSRQKKERGRIKEVTSVTALVKTPETLFRENVNRIQSESQRESGSGAGNVVKEQPRHALSVVRGSRKRVEEALKRGVRPLFSHESDSFLAMYCQPGVEVPPPPINEDLKMDFVASLSDPILIEEGDTPDQIALKEMVASMRSDLKGHIFEGGTFEEYFQMLANRQETEVAIRNDAFDSYQKMIDDGEDGEMAAAYWKKMNEVLAKRGIEKIPLDEAHRPYLTEEELAAYDAESNEEQGTSANEKEAEVK